MTGGINEYGSLEKLNIAWFNAYQKKMVVSLKNQQKADQSTQMLQNLNLILEGKKWKDLIRQ